MPRPPGYKKSIDLMADFLFAEMRASCRLPRYSGPPFPNCPEVISGFRLQIPTLDGPPINSAFLTLSEKPLQPIVSTPATGTQPVKDSTGLDRRGQMHDWLEKKMLRPLRIAVKMDPGAPAPE